jgi:uncharacterized protein (DUF736 family)
MAIIGKFKTTDEGYIETLTIKAQAAIRSAKKSKDSQPDFNVIHIAEDFESDIGDAWKETSQRDSSEYLSVSLDDPLFTSKIYCRLVKTGAEKDHTLFWDRPRPSYEKE